MCMLALTNSLQEINSQGPLSPCTIRVITRCLSLNLIINSPYTIKILLSILYIHLTGWLTSVVDLVSLTDALGLRVCVTQAKRKAGTMEQRKPAGLRDTDTRALAWILWGLTHSINWLAPIIYKWPGRKPINSTRACLKSHWVTGIKNICIEHLLCCLALQQWNRHRNTFLERAVSIKMPWTDRHRNTYQVFW